MGSDVAHSPSRIERDGLEFVMSLIKQQDRRNAYLSEQIRQLDKKIEEIKALEKEKESLIARMKAIETLPTSRPIIVHLFDELVSTLPEGVYLRNVSQTGNKVTIQGVAQSNARVSNYMRNVEASEWVESPKLSIIQSKSQEGRRETIENIVQEDSQQNRGRTIRKDRHIRKPGIGDRHPALGCMGPQDRTPEQILDHARRSVGDMVGKSLVVVLHHGRAAP